MAIDLTQIPAPGVIEELNYNSILERQRLRFMALWAAIRLANPGADLPTYDVELLETDPAMIVSQSESYREVLLRARINDAARANLLAFARDGDLDHLAGFYDVVRLFGEDDDRLLLRTILAIQGRSTGGTEERYKYIAMTADLEVANVAVYRVGKSPLIYVSVYSTSQDGVASSSLLQKVEAALTLDTVKMVNDTFAFASAVRTVVDIEADAWLLPEAAATTLVSAENNLRTAWDAARGLGRDLTVSWWTSKLMISGLHKISPVSPSEDTIVLPHEAVSIGNVKLNNRGRAF